MEKNTNEPTNPTPHESERHRETTHVPPRIYVASLADYNNGRLHGQWLDPTIDVDALYAAVTRMLGQSREYGAEEFAIHDYEGFYDFHVGEYDRLDTIHDIACGIAEHGEAYAEYVSLVGTEDASLDGFIDSYLDAAGWDTEIEQLRQHSPLGPFITLDRDDLLTTLRCSLNVVEGREGVHVFYS